MNILKDLKLQARAFKRFSAFSKAIKNGDSNEQARQYIDRLYPPTIADLDFEDRLRRREISIFSFPWISAVVLAYPIMAATHAGHLRADQLDIFNFAIVNLAYVLLVAGILAGKFGILGLNKRSHVLVSAVFCLIVSLGISNIGILTQ